MDLAAEQQFPTKWPFPPAPPARRARWALLSPRRGGRHRGLPGVSAAPVPAPASFPASHPAAASFSSSVAGATSGAAISGDVTLRQMIVDILLVAMWGAMIPAFMWLGAAAGF